MNISRGQVKRCSFTYENLRFIHHVETSWEKLSDKSHCQSIRKNWQGPRSLSNKAVHRMFSEGGQLGKDFL